MEKIEKEALGEYILADTEVRESIPPGDCATEGGSEWKNDAGDEGGAAKGSGILLLVACVVELIVVAAAFAPEEGVVSVTRTACPMRFRLFLRCPKHQ